MLSNGGAKAASKGRFDRRHRQGTVETPLAAGSFDFADDPFEIIRLADDQRDGVAFGEAPRHGRAETGSDAYDNC